MSREQQEQQQQGDGELSRRAFARRASLTASGLVGGALLAEVALPTAAEAAVTTWSLTGNAGTTGSQYLGTTDARPLVLRTAALERLRVTSAGDVGIGTTAPAAQFHVSQATSTAGLFDHTATTGAQPALRATTASKDAGAIAIQGSVTSTTPGTNASGVRGTNSGTGTNGNGVWGSHAGNGNGVFGSVTGTGAGGRFTGRTTGVLVDATDSAGTAVLAQNTSTSSDLAGSAVRGYAVGGDDTRVHPTGMFYDAAAEFCGLNGLIGAAGPNANQDGYGVIGLADNSFGTGVYARGTGGAKALLAVGNVDVRGTLTKSGGSFRIDHPLAPATKYLSHSFVESPDMKNVYDGVITTDTTGTATVQMPEWFDALNQDVRYQLTPLGAAAPDLHVSAELHHGRFSIAGAKPAQRISWQLTGTRKDAWAQAHRIPVEQDKPESERGRYLHPELHDVPVGARPGAQIGAQVTAQRTSVD